MTLRDRARRLAWRFSKEARDRRRGQKVREELAEEVRPNPDFPRSLRHRRR